jgi:hypothetical protein
MMHVCAEMHRSVVAVSVLEDMITSLSKMDYEK